MPPKLDLGPPPSKRRQGQRAPVVLSQMKMRASNQEAHPERAHTALDSKRRTSSEVKIAREEEVRTKEAAQKAIDDGLKTIAQIIHKSASFAIRRGVHRLRLVLNHEQRITALHRATGERWHCPWRNQRRRWP